MKEMSKKIEQIEFLDEYFKNKSDYEKLDHTLKHDVGCISQYVKHGITDIRISEEKDRYYKYHCEISSIELSVLIGVFVLPETYEKFKIVLDILLGEYGLFKNK